MIHDISRAIFALLTRILLRLSVKGKYNIPASGGFIVASNHASYLDPVILGIASSRRLNYMAKDSLFQYPVLRGYMHKIHAFPVKRKSADFSALKEALRRLRAGKGLVIFPEGTRQEPGTFGKPERGVGFLISKSEVPVVPAFVKGTAKALPKGSGILRPFNRITVSFGKAILPEKAKSYEEVAEEVMAEIKRLSVVDNKILI